MRQLALGPPPPGGIPGASGSRHEYGPPGGGGQTDRQTDGQSSGGLALRCPHREGRNHRARLLVGSFAASREPATTTMSMLATDVADSYGASRRRKGPNSIKSSVFAGRFREAAGD